MTNSPRQRDGDSRLRFSGEICPASLIADVPVTNPELRTMPESVMPESVRAI